MEAKGHQEIGKKQFHLIKEYLKVNGISQNVEEGAFYLGNWLADYSQLLDEGPKKKLLQLILLPNMAAKAVSETSGKVKKVADDLKKNNAPFFSPSTIPIIDTAVALFQSKVKDISTSFLTNSASLLKDLEVSLLSLQLKGSNLNSLNFQSDWNTKIKNKSPLDTTHELADDILRTTVKILGLKEFVLADLDDDKKLSPDIYIHTINKLLPNKYYVPYEHLDRPFDYDIIGKITPGITEKGFDKLLVRAIDKKKNNKDSHLYDYLQDYLQLAFQKLIRSEVYFKKIKSGTVKFEKHNFHLELAKLGNTLHTIEDFFAHSNFLDFATLVAQEKFPPTDKQIKNLYNFSAIENDRIKKSIIELREDTQKITDTKIATGYFSKEDLYVSIFHLFAGKLLNISDLDSSKEFIDVENMDTLLDKKVKEFEDELKNAKEIKEFLIAKDKVSYFKKKKKIEFISERQVVNLFCINPDSKNSTKLVPLIIAPYLCNIINSIIAIKVITGVTEITKSAQGFIGHIIAVVKAIVTIIRIIILIIQYPYQIYRIIAPALNVILPQTLKKAATEFIKYEIEKICLTTLKSIFGKEINELENRIGCHSIIAKDEEFEKKNFYSIATFLAEKMDSFIISNIFELYSEKKDDKNTGKEEKFINWSEVLDKYFKCSFMEGQVKKYHFFKNKYLPIQNYADLFMVRERYVPLYKTDKYIDSLSDYVVIPYSETYMKLINKENIKKSLQEVEIFSSLKQVWYFFPFFKFEKEDIENFLNYQIPNASANLWISESEFAAINKELIINETKLIAQYREVSVKTTFFKAESPKK